MEFPSFELQANGEALRHLAGGIAGWRAERMGGDRAANVWIRCGDGTMWFIGVDQRAVRRMFEVFTLDIVSIEELQERWARWEPPALPPDVPEGFRRLITTRPPRPEAPVDLNSWPFASWRTDVLRRAEFIVEGAAGPTFGENPNSQSAVRPGQVPDDASAFCEVAAGMLFTSGRGEKMLMAVDWMPMQMIVSQDTQQIDAYLADCEQIPLAEYIQRLPVAS